MEQKKDEALINHRGIGGGVESKLSESEITIFKEKLCAQELWSKSEIVQLLSDEFSINYSGSHLHYLLRKLGMNYYKPESEDYRRHPESQEKLITRIQATFDAFMLMNQDVNRIVIGVADESSMQNYHHSNRFWSMYSGCKKKINSNKYRINAFGFQAINGKSVLLDLPNSKEENIIKALQQIKEANPFADRIILIWDNYRVHKMKSVLQAARRMNIFLVQLPVYAPDLNPIERLWKSIKKKISAKGFIADRDELFEIVKDNFYKLESRISWFKAWINDILLKALPQDCPTIFGKLL